MNDLIKRSDAIEAVGDVTWYHQNRNKDMVEGANSAEHQAWYKSQDIYEALEAIPSADRPQGEWKIVPPNAWELNGIIQWHECSVCKCRSMFISDYCPHCGAKMKGADNE